MKYINISFISLPVRLVTIVTSYSLQQIKNAGDIDRSTLTTHVKLDDDETESSCA